MVNPDWLKYFLALVETQNFTAAAEKLYISPQAMSNAIAGLEAHYGQRLVERGARMRGLTPAGEALREEAPLILAQLANTERRLASIAQGEPQGPVSIASAGYITQYLLAKPLTALIRRYPGLLPRVLRLTTSEIEERLASGSLDFGVLMQAPTRSDLEWVLGPSCPYVIVGQPAAPQPWDSWGYIVPPRKPGGGCGSERHLEGPWPERQHQRRAVAEVEQIETALSLAEAGAGAVYVPELAVRSRLAAGTLAIVATPPAPYADQLYVVWRKGVQPMRACLDMLMSLGDGLVGEAVVDEQASVLS